MDWMTLAQAVEPVLFAREGLGFDPDPTQERLLNAGIRRGILNCTRQWGKSTVTAAKAVHQAVRSREPDAGGEPERAAERGVPAEGGGVSGGSWGSGRRGRGQRDVAGAAERVADCGAAGERSDGARIFGGARCCWWTRRRG